MEHDGLWDFLSYGDYTASRKSRNIYFEALLWLEFSYDESVAYSDASQKMSTYGLSALRLERFRTDIFASVVGERRTKLMMESALQSNRYRLEADTARAFCALQDYRAKTGENRTTLFLARNLPA